MGGCFANLFLKLLFYDFNSNPHTEAKAVNKTIRYRGTAQVTLQFAGQYIRNDLAETGAEVLGRSLGQWGYDAVNTAGYSAIPAAATYGFGAIGGNAAAQAMAATSLYHSTNGSVYKKYIESGYTQEQARECAGVTATVFSFATYMLSGISYNAGGARTSGFETGTGALTPGMQSQALALQTGPAAGSSVQVEIVTGMMSASAQNAAGPLEASTSSQMLKPQLLQPLLDAGKRSAPGTALSDYARSIQAVLSQNGEISAFDIGKLYVERFMPDVAQKQLSEQIDSDWYGNVDEHKDKGYTGKEGEFDDIDLSGASDSDLQNQPVVDAALDGYGGAGAEGAGKTWRPTDDLVNSATTPGKGGVSPVGRAYQKHAGNPNRAGTFTGEVSGNAMQNMQNGTKYLNDILNNPNSTYTVRNTKAFGDVLDVRLPDGTGARWSADGKTFIGFLEKYTK